MYHLLLMECNLGRICLVHVDLCHSLGFESSTIRLFDEQKSAHDKIPSLIEVPNNWAFKVRKNFHPNIALQ